REAVKNIKAPLVLLAAHGALRLAAERQLERAGKLVLPEILVCAVGPAHRYLERVYNVVGPMEPMQTVDDLLIKIESMMRKAYKEVEQQRDVLHITTRQAAHSLALKRLLEGTIIRGIHPR